MSRARNFLLLGVILLCAFALRIYQLGAASLWYDETVSVWLARQDLAEITRHTAGDIHPPLYYYLLHFWGLAAGWSEFSVAFLSLGFGLLLVALVYRVARRYLPRGGATAGLLAAFLVALSPYNVWYSQEVRMYMLGAFLGLASFYFLALGGQRLKEVPVGRLTDKKNIWFPAIAFVLLNVGGLYTLYYYVFFLAFENLVILVWVIRRRLSAIRAWLVSQFAILLLFAPWLPIAFRQATDPPVPPWREFTPLQSVLLQSFGALTLGQSIDPLAALPLVLVALAIIVFAFTSARQTRIGIESPFAFNLSLFAYTVVPLALIFLLSLWKPLYHVRYVFTYSPAFYILLAQSMVTVANRPNRIARVGSWVLGFGIFGFSLFSLYNFWSNSQFATDDLRGAVQHIEANWRPGDVMLVNAGYAYTALLYFDSPLASRERLSSYQPQTDDAANGALVLMTGSIGGNPSLGWGDPRSDFYATTAEETTAALDRVFASHPRVWMLRIYDTVVDPDGVMRQYFADHATLIDETVYSGEANARVLGYLTTRALPNDIPSEARRVNAIFGDRLTLAGVARTTNDARAGTSYDIALYWRADQLLNLNYHTSVQIFSADGNKVGQADEEPLGNQLPMTRWDVGKIYNQPVRVHIDPNAAPGEYDVRVVVYNPASGEPLAEPMTVATITVK